MNKLKNNSSKKKIITYLILYITFSVNFGCTKKESLRKTKDANPIVVEVNRSSSFVLTAKYEENYIKVYPTKFPEGEIKNISCEINSTQVQNCIDGIKIHNPKDGQYFVSYFIEIKNSKPENAYISFKIENRLLTEIKNTEEIVSQPKLSLATKTPTFKNYMAIKKDQSLHLKFKLITDRHCNPKYLCSRTEGIWSLCSRNNKPSIEITPMEIAKGFQRLSIKALCQNNDKVSNILDLYWYGVDQGYKPLALQARKLTNTQHYKLVRKIDCMGQISYECRDSETETFHHCPNVKTNPKIGFQIRAKCIEQDKSSYGPTYTNK